MTEIAVFGGTFDPPTKAHAGIIEACLANPVIDEVWLMPSGQRPDKAGMLPDAVRVAMLELVKTDVFDNDPRITITDIEQQLPQPTQTYNTVTALAERHPEHRFWYVYGADSYHDMPTWNRGADLRRSMAMLVLPRDGYALPDETETIKHITLTDKVDAHLSSTKLREAAADQLPLDAFTCGAVARYIQHEGLYLKALARDTVMA